jgi:UDP-glucose 4-epimerase
VAGGAGFIGSHVAARLLAGGAEVTVFDNLSSGSPERVPEGARLIEGDLKDLDALRAAVAGNERVFHFAANPDIARAATEPAIDFWEGTYLHSNLLEACRLEGVGRIVYASGSGVYGDQGDRVVDELAARTDVVSTYAASKLGCEAMLSSYCHMFGMHGAAFRFANVVGEGQTHGVTYDFVRKLRTDPSRLEVLGDGNQSKSYIHVDDVVDAMFLVVERGWEGYVLYNVATEDHVTVREIADLAVAELGLHDVELAFTGGARGWKGDVPVVRMDSSRIRELGWANRYSAREAVVASLRANLTETAGATPRSGTGV